MPAVRCPFPGCDYITENLDSAVVIALINAHTTAHAVGQAAKAESVKPPTAAAPGSVSSASATASARTQDTSGRQINRKSYPRLCYKYNGRGCEKAGTCPYIHMCKNYIEGRCESGKGCRKSHDIFNPEVKTILEKYGINTKRKPRAVLADFQAAVKEDESSQINHDESGNSKAEKSTMKTSKHAAIEICHNYSNSNGCGRPGTCFFIHMCRSYVDGRCESGKGCSKNHDVFNPEVKAVLEKHGINTKRRPREVLADLQAALKGDGSKSTRDERGKSKAGYSQSKPQKQMILKLCYRYNGKGCENGGACPYIHMCRIYVESRCEAGKKCSRSHDILDPAVKAILEKHGINTSRRPREILTDLQAAVKADGDRSRHERLGLLRVSEYSDIHGSGQKTEYGYSSMPRSLDRDLFLI